MLLFLNCICGQINVNLGRTTSLWCWVLPSKCKECLSAIQIYFSGFKNVLKFSSGSANFLLFLKLLSVVAITIDNFLAISEIFRKLLKEFGKKEETERKREKIKQ